MTPVTHTVTLTLQNPDGGMHFTADSEDEVITHLDSDESVGGVGMGMRPQKMLLASLAGCSGMDVISIMRKKRQNVTGFEVQVRGEKAEEHPRVYTKIWLTFIFTGHDIDPAACERSIELSITRYCPVAGLLKHVVPIETGFEVKEA